MDEPRETVLSFGLKHETAERQARRYEIVARLFKLSTGFIAPGFSVPPEACSDQYEIDRIQAWNHWTENDKATAALNEILWQEERFEHYDQLFSALEQSDTNQIRQERDNLRLRIKAVDEEHAQLKIDREKMVQEYTILEVDRNLWRTQAEADAKERDFYKRMWAIRGKALERPCLGCGYTGQAIRLKNGEIP